MLTQRSGVRVSSGSPNKGLQFNDYEPFVFLCLLKY